MIRIIFLLLLLFPALHAGAAVPNDPAAANLSVFDNEIKTIVNTAMKPTSDLGKIAWSLWSTFVFILVFRTVAMFMFRGLDLTDILVMLLQIFASLIMMNTYEALTRMIWDGFGSIGFAIQNIALGNSDPYFMAIYVHEAFAMVDLGKVDIFDAMGTIFWYAIFIVLSAFLELMLYVGSSWALWGYSLAKLIGLVFVPFMLLESTRNIFDGWFKLFIGFVIYNMLVRVVMVLFCVFIKATLGHPTTPIVMEASASPEIITLVTFMLTGILLTLSVSGFAAIIAGGFTSPSAAYASVSRFSGNFMPGKGGGSSPSKK